MRINLCLQCIKLELALHLLAFDDVIHQLPDALHHRGKRLGERCNLLVSPYSRGGREVTTLHTVHQSLKFLDWSADICRNSACDEYGCNDTEGKDDEHNGGVLIESCHQFVHICYPDDSPSSVVHCVYDDQTFPSFECVGKGSEDMFLD